MASVFLISATRALISFAIASAVDDDGVVLRDLDLTGTAQVSQLHVRQVHVQLARDIRAAGENGDVLEHFLAAVAEAGSLDADAVEAAAQTVDKQGRQRVALDVLSDDEQLLAALDDLLEDRQRSPEWRKSSCR